MAQTRTGGVGWAGVGVVTMRGKSPGMGLSPPNSASTMQPGAGPFPSLCLCHFTCTRVGLEFLTAMGSSTDYTNIN